MISLALSASALAQGEPDVRISLPETRGRSAGYNDVPVWIEPLIPEPGSEAWAEAQARGAREADLRRTLRIIRGEHFRTGDVERRQVGLWKLNAFGEPWMTPILFEEFAREAEDVRTGLLDQLAARGDEASDAAIAWAAVFDRDEQHREAAALRLRRRVDHEGALPMRAQLVVAGGLADRSESAIRAAAGLADTFNLVQLIPLMIQAQVASTGGSSPRTGDLAWIMVATQTAFVSDLQPVVADSAVAFDPQLSVITEGTLLRVGDAVVTTYRGPVHQSLVNLTTRHWGKPTDGFGYDTKRWEGWYRAEFVPHMRARGLEPTKDPRGALTLPSQQPSPGARHESPGR